MKNKRLLVLMFSAIIGMTAVAQDSDDLELEFEEYSENNPELPPQEAPYISEEVTPQTPQLGDDLLDSSEVLAEEELPPQEAPYITEDSEPVPMQATTPAFREDPLMPQESRMAGPRGKRKINHPLASKGLVAITKDGSYIYRTESGIKSQSASFRLGQIQSPGIESADGTTNFERMYGTGTYNMSFEYEWQPFTGWGKLGVLLGAGLFRAEGEGRFLSDGSEAKEVYSFWGIPLSAGVSYRLEFSDRQWLAPYVLGGLSYYALAETRDDGAQPNYTGTAAAFGGGGLLFSITHWDRESAHTMWSEYGIANMWVSLELRAIQSFSEDLDVSSNHVNLGLTFDY